MHLAFAVEIALIVLLAATLVYCAILERRLTALRKGQDGFQQTIADLNTTIASAGTSMRALKSAAADAAENLDDRLVRARNLVDELSLLTTSGDRIAERIERSATSERAKTPSTPAVLANRLDALKPQNLKAETARIAAMGRVR